MEITEELAIKVRDVIDRGLVRGAGDPHPGRMCVEAAVCYALGLPHGDNPEECVSQSLRILKIGLNDKGWNNEISRAKGLRRLGISQLGSAGVLNETDFLTRLSKMTIQKMLPLALRSSALQFPLYKNELEEAAGRCEKEGTIDSVIRARKACDLTKLQSIIYPCIYAQYLAASSAASVAYYSACCIRSASQNYYDGLDKALADYCEWVVQILIEMQAPGTKYLYLVPLEEG